MSITLFATDAMGHGVISTSERENPSQHNHAKGARYNVNYTQKGQETKAQEWQQRKIFCLPRKLEMPRKRHLFSCATALSGCKPTKEKALGHLRWGRQCCSACVSWLELDRRHDGVDGAGGVLVSLATNVSVKCSLTVSRRSSCCRQCKQRHCCV